MNRATGRFAVDQPEGWFRVDLDPETRARSAARPIDGWVARHPELAGAATS